MDLNKLDNDAADHVINLIDILIGTPVLQAESSDQKNNKQINQISSLKYIIDPQIPDDITDYHENKNYTNVIDKRLSSPTEYIIGLDNDKILPIGFYKKQNNINKTKFIPKIEMNASIEYADNANLKKKLPKNQRKYELIESYGDDNLTEIKNKKKIYRKQKKYHTTNISKSNIKQKFKNTSKTNKQISNQKIIGIKNKRVYTKPLDMNADTDSLEKSNEENDQTNNKLVQNLYRSNLFTKQKKTLLNRDSEITNTIFPVAQNIIPKNINETQNNHKYDLLINMINYLIVLIDYLNKIIYQIMALLGGG